MSPASYQTAPPRGAAAKVAQRGRGRNGQGDMLAAGGRGRGPVALGGQGLLDQLAHPVDVALVFGEVVVGEGVLGGLVLVVGLRQEALEGLFAGGGLGWWGGGAGVAGWCGGGLLAADDLGDGVGEGVGVADLVVVED